jgi:hypothetical protein
MELKRQVRWSMLSVAWGYRKINCAGWWCHAVQDFETLATDGLLLTMQRGQPSDRAVKDAEQTYSTLRERARDTWRATHGRR